MHRLDRLDSDSARIVIGQTLFPYRLLRELGRGAMDVIYEAEDVRLGRKVALELQPEAMARGAGRMLPMLDGRGASAE